MHEPRAATKATALRLRFGFADSAVRGWASLFATVLARGYLTFIATLMLVAIVPALGTWHSYVVRTDSMAPTVRPGDVVVTSPLAPDASLPLGRVVALTDPSHGAARRVLIHRVVVDRGDGFFVTAGDANRVYDSTPAPRASFLGLARLRVPWIGLPGLWVADRDFAPLIIWMLLTLAALAVVLTDHRDPAPPLVGPATARERHRRTRDTRIPHVLHRSSRARAAGRVSAAFAVLIVVTALAVTRMGAGVATFSARTANPGDSWTLQTRILLGYTAAVLVDLPYVYYPLQESAGPAMADASGNAGRAGTYVASIAFRRPGAWISAPDYAVGLSGGGGRLMSGGTAVSNPTTYSLELWFKTTTTTGGKLIGFESTQQSTSSKFDRHLFMRNDGRLVYGGWGSSSRTITTPLAYNNGLWHHTVVTARPNSGNQQSVIYVDGVSVASSTNTSAVSSYSGWWRVGYGSLASGGNYPAGADFTGTIDDVAVYGTVLSAARVAAHFAAR